MSRALAERGIYEFAQFEFKNMKKGQTERPTFAMKIILIRNLK